MLKKNIILIALVLTTNASSFDYKLEPQEVSKDLWCFFGALESPSKENAGNIANSCYIKTKSNYVVFDSGPSYEYAAQSYEAMSKISKLPVLAVIASHEHDDHWLGNNFYKEKFNSELIGPSTINENYKVGDKTRMFQVLPKSAIEGTKIVKLDTVVDKNITRDFDGKVFEIIPIHTKAHTDKDIFVYLPSEKIILAGDLVMNGRITSNRHGSLLGQIKAIEMINKKDWDIIVNGHGLKYGKDGINEAWEYFTSMKKKVVKALDDDVDLGDINKIVKMEKFQDKALFDELNAKNVAGAFTELELLE